MKQSDLDFTKRQGEYFNTTSETGDVLKRSKEKCGRQEDEIAAMFEFYKQLSPSQVYELYPDANTPITSIRRAITVLTDKKVIEKTNQQVIGLYGKKEYVWKLREAA